MMIIVNWKLVKNKLTIRKRDIINLAFNCNKGIKIPEYIRVVSPCTLLINNISFSNS